MLYSELKPVHADRLYKKKLNPGKPGILLFLLLYCCEAFSQLSRPGVPESFSLKTKNTINIPERLLEPIDTAYLLSEEKANGIPNRYGQVQQLEINIKNEGVVTPIEGKGKIWQYKIRSGSAYSIGILFSSFHMPPGAGVFIYNEDQSLLKGEFTQLNNNPSNTLPIGEFRGKEAIIEYFEPLNPIFEGQLVIGSISQAYKDLLQPNLDRIGINCPEGAQWQDLKHSVCLMTFRDAHNAYYCSGFLVNNVREDGTPYFQTANHCLNTNAMASTLMTYFNFDNTGCLSSDAQYNQSLSGATLKATNDNSDFTLLLLNEYPTTQYLPYYAGWDATGNVPETGTCIHHPSGTPKCISTDQDPLHSFGSIITWQDGSQFTSSSPNTHWEVVFTSGSVESGSSGSPLYNENKRVVGQLHGGSGTDNFYGKFSLSWNESPVASQQLKCWLDPDSTGLLSLEGTYMTVKPVSRFSTGFSNVCKDAVIKFKDNSIYAPTQWNWSIFPAGFQFVNGTNINSKNPEVVFNNTGTYSVELVAANDYGADTLIKTNYISSGNIQVGLTGLPADGIVCGCNLNKYPLKFSGANSYSFYTDRPDKIDSRLSFDSVYISVIPQEKKYGSFNTWLKLTGVQGNCIATDSIMMQVRMPPNDDIENAIQLWPGRSTIYTNTCASVQTFEPHPPDGSCIAANNWCPVSGNTDSVLSSTIWFTFTGPPDGIISINAGGFSNRIAIYDAESYNSIISGSSASFDIIAAIDSHASGDSTARLENIAVTPYKKYWLQLDGSAKRTGNCIITLNTNTIEVYPNPSSGLFNIIFPGTANGLAEVKIISTTGRVMFSTSMNVTPESNSFSFDLSTFARGLYFVQANCNGSITKAKLMLTR